ncbi:MAG: DUF5665 domain-containing protein [Paracoccaceae bacterium]
MEENTNALTAEIEALRKEVVRLNEHSFVKMHNSTARLVMIQLLRGLAFGLGSVLGATILVSVAAYLLAQIDFIPIIGDWAAQIADQIGVARSGSGE